MNVSRVHISNQWRDVLSGLRKESPSQIVYVLGKSDSGKTTFSQYLVERLFRKYTVAYIDCDPGQSIIGPPTTVGLSIYRKGKQEEQKTVLYFIGSTSPARHMLQTVSGIVKLVQKAGEMKAHRIILDSSGFVIGKPAEELQFQIIDMIQPNYLIVFQKVDELDNLLKNFVHNRKIELFRMSVSFAAVNRKISDRQIYREDKFRKYFQSAKDHELSLESVGFHGMIPDLHNPRMYQNRLIALCDEENFVLTLSIVLDINMAKKVVRFYAPSFEKEKVCTIQFGSIYLDKTGRQIYTPPGLSHMDRA